MRFTGADHLCDFSEGMVVPTSKLVAIDGNQPNQRTWRHFDKIIAHGAFRLPLPDSRFPSLLHRIEF